MWYLVCNSRWSRGRGRVKTRHSVSLDTFNCTNLSFYIKEFFEPKLFKGFVLRKTSMKLVKFYYQSPGGTKLKLQLIQE